MRILSVLLLTACATSTPVKDNVQSCRPPTGLTMWCLDNLEEHGADPMCKDALEEAWKPCDEEEFPE